MSEISNDNGTESDSSIGTNEMNDLQSSLTESFKEEKEEDPEIPVLKKKKKHKNLKISESQNRKIAKSQVVPILKQEYEQLPKKKGRPPMPVEEKLAKKVVKKERIVYVIQDSDGNLVRKDPAKLGVRDLRKLKIEDEAQKTEIEYGKKLARLKSGKPKIPKPRTEAQKAATEKMLEANRLRRAGKKSVEKTERKEEIKEVVKESVKEVVQEPAVPIPIPQKSIEQQYFDFFS